MEFSYFLGQEFTVRELNLIKIDKRDGVVFLYKNPKLLEYLIIIDIVNSLLNIAEIFVSVCGENRQWLIS